MLAPDPARKPKPVQASASVQVAQAALMDGAFAGAPASGCIKSVMGLGAASFDASLWLFSLGLMVDRTTMNLFRTSNQKGAPSMMAKAVTNQPMTALISAPAANWQFFSAGDQPSIPCVRPTDGESDFSQLG